MGLVGERGCGSASFPFQPRTSETSGTPDGTNAASLYHKTDTEVGEIKYVDVSSLYPWVNANGEYPVGHPDIITNPVDQDTHSYFRCGPGRYSALLFLPSRVATQTRW